MENKNIQTYTNKSLYYRDAIFDLINQYKKFLNNDPAISDTMLNKHNTFNSLLLYIGNNLFNNNIMSINGSIYNSDLSVNDYITLDYLFNIYTSLCGKYNNKITIKGFCMFINISSNKLKEIATSAGANPEIIKLVNKIKDAQEQTFISSNLMFDVFLLKALHGYTDQPNMQVIESRSVAALPDIYSKYGALIPPDTAGTGEI